MKDLRGAVLRGLLWSFTGQAGRQAVLLASNVVLARLLTPRDFGLVAMILVVVNFALILAEQGLGAAVIQRARVSQEQLSSVFWLNVAVGFLLTVLLAAGAPLVAWAYREPELKPLMAAVSTLFAVNSLGTVHSALLSKRLEFRTLALVEVLAAWIYGGIAIAMAWAGYGVWSIAIQSVLGAGVTAAALWRLCSWRPSPVFRWGAVRELLGFSTSLLVNNVCNYWVRNVDNLLIGLVWGSAPLGIYTRAYAVMLFPLSRVSRIFSRVMLPSFSILQEDRPRVKVLFLRMTRGIALATFPMMLGVLAAAEPFVATVFGRQWGAMVPVLRVLCLVGLFQSVTTLLGNLYFSQNEAQLRLKVALPLQGLQVLGIVLGLPWGILGVAAGYAAASLVVMFPDARAAGRLVGLSVGELAAALQGILLCASAMAGCVWLLGLGLSRALPAPGRLAAQVLAGIALYVGLLALFRVQGLDDALSLYRELVKQRKASSSHA